MEKVVIKPSRDTVEQWCNCKKCSARTCNECLLYTIAEKLLTDRVTPLQAFQMRMAQKNGGAK